MKLFACSFEVPPIIEYEQGKVVGSFDTDRMGKQYLSFQGIPYARPPVANLRFKVRKKIIFLLELLKMSSKICDGI